MENTPQHDKSMRKLSSLCGRRKQHIPPIQVSRVSCFRKVKQLKTLRVYIQINIYIYTSMANEYAKTTTQEMFVLAMLCWPDNDFLLDYLIIRLFLKNYARKWTAKVGCFEKLSRRRSSGYSQALAARESNRSDFVPSLRYASQCLFSLF